MAFDKPYEWTSFGLVAKVRYLLCKRLGVKKLKVGHAGTLDPLATGVLLVCTGKATKRIEELQAHTKEYVATLRLGATTPSFDLEKPVDAEYPTEHITREMVEETLNRFVGTIEQVPPVFSACKVNGSRAYDLARKGEEVELQAHTKEYVATLRLGATTPSFDLEKPVDAEYPTEHITREMVEETLNRFVGTIEQVPPVFSACKVNGSRAYDLARKGEEVELKAKTLVIDEMELLRCELPEIVIRVVCSKGTYIRALARDIGVALQSGAHLTALRRTRIGAVRVEDCLKLDDFAEWLNRQTIEITEDN